jgi:t-SNARE complex subunit (syntaxin)
MSNRFFQQILKNHQSTPITDSKKHLNEMGTLNYLEFLTVWRFVVDEFQYYKQKLMKKKSLLTELTLKLNNATISQKIYELLSNRTKINKSISNNISSHREGDIQREKTNALAKNFAFQKFSWRFTRFWRSIKTFSCFYESKENADNNYEIIKILELKHQTLPWIDQKKSQEGWHLELLKN